MLMKNSTTSPCEQYLPLIHDYVTAQLENDPTIARFVDLRKHLDECASCAKFYMVWYDTMRRENEGSLPSVDGLRSREAALEILARLSGRPPKPPSLWQKFVHVLSLGVKHFWAGLRGFFASGQFAFIARRMVYNSVGLAALIVVLFGVIASNNGFSKQLSRMLFDKGGSGKFSIIRETAPTIKEMETVRQSRNALESDYCISPLPTPPPSPAPTTEKAPVAPQVEAQQVCATSTPVSP